MIVKILIKKNIIGDCYFPELSGIHDGICLSHLQDKKYLVYLLCYNGLNKKGDIILIKNNKNEYQYYDEYAYLIPIIRKTMREMKLKRILTEKD